MDVFYLNHSEAGWKEANKRVKQINTLVETPMRNTFHTQGDDYIGCSI
jgi:hypothetical protein